MMTVEEMVDIWNNKPIGYIEKLSRDIAKGKKKYVVSFVPYKKEYLEPIEVEVYAKSRDRAIDKARYKKHDLIPGYDYETRVKAAK